MSAIVKPNRDSALEALIVQGNLRALDPGQRVEYYRAFCEALELNPVTRPFDYLELGGKLVLYANKGCTEQLRMKRAVSLRVTSRERVDDVYYVEVEAKQGERVDFATGAVSVAGLKGEAFANAVMKAETKAKRRATLSICGLGMMDESEVDSVPNARRVQAVEVEPAPRPALVAGLADPRPTPAPEPAPVDHGDPGALFMGVPEEPAPKPKAAPAPKPVPSPAEVAASELHLLTQAEEAKKAKDGSWTLYRIHTKGGQTFGTFNARVFNDAKTAIELDLPVRIVAKTTAKGNLEIESMVVLEPEPEGAVIEDEAPSAEALAAAAIFNEQQTAAGRLAGKIKGVK